MQEFKHIGDRITVLRDGKKIATVNIDEVNDMELVNMMVGRDISQVYHRSENHFTGEVLRTEKLSDKKEELKKWTLLLTRVK